MGAKTNSMEMQKAFYNHTYQRYDIVAPNIFLTWSNEMDLLGFRRSGYIDEIEIKISTSDFKADFKKSCRVKGVIKENSWGVGSYQEYIEIFKHDALEHGLIAPNYFSFLIPEELIDKCIIPEYAGLYVFRIDNAGIGRVREERRAPLLHKRKISDQKRYEIGRKMAFRYWDLIK